MTTYVQFTAIDLDKNNIYQELLNEIKKSPAFYTKEAKIDLFPEKNIIQFRHGLNEIEASFPYFKKSIIGLKRLTVNNLIDYVQVNTKIRYGNKESNFKATCKRYIDGYKTKYLNINAFKLDYSLLNLRLQNRSEFSSFIRKNGILPFVKKQLQVKKYFIPLMQDLFSKYPGICIGESHDETFGKYLLIKNFKKLKEFGVTTIFLEHFLIDTQGSYFLNMFNHRMSFIHQEFFCFDMPLIFYEYAKELDLNHILSIPGSRIQKEEHGFFSLIIHAINAGIKVIPIDTDATYSVIPKISISSESDDERLMSLNYKAAKIIEKNMKSNEKYIIFCGSAHCKKGKDIGVSGFSDIFKIPTIVVQDSRRLDKFYEGIWPSKQNLYAKTEVDFYILGQAENDPSIKKYYDNFCQKMNNIKKNLIRHHNLSSS